MNRHDIVAIQKKIRESKDKLKKNILVDTKIQSSIKFVMPPNLYTPNDYTNADQWYFNGFILDINGDLFVVDPGVDFYSRFTATGYDFSKITTLIVTHNHIDHTASAVLLIEKLIKYKNPRMRIYMSKDAWDTKVPEYIKQKVLTAEYRDLVQMLHGNSGDSMQFEITKDITIKFISLYHSCPDTFGFSIVTPEESIGYISDTGYSILVETANGVEKSECTTGEYRKIIEKHTYIQEFYKRCNSIVVNINDLDYNRHSKYHLSGWDLLDMLQDSGSKKIILQHLSSVNAEGEDSNYLYKLFFMDQGYDVYLPHFTGRIINI